MQIVVPDELPSTEMMQLVRAISDQLLLYQCICLESIAQHNYLMPAVLSALPAWITCFPGYTSAKRTQSADRVQRIDIRVRCTLQSMWKPSQAANWMTPG